MAIRRMINMLSALAERDVQQLRNTQQIAVRTEGVQTSDQSEQQSLIVERAQIVSVFSTSGAVLSLGGRTFSAAQATDEPFRAGQFVYVSRAADGSYVIHGGAK